MEIMNLTDFVVLFYTSSLLLHFIWLSLLILVIIFLWKLGRLYFFLWFKTDKIGKAFEACKSLKELLNLKDDKALKIFRSILYPVSYWVSSYIENDKFINLTHYNALNFQIEVRDRVKTSFEKVKHNLFILPSICFILCLITTIILSIYISITEARGLPKSEIPVQSILLNFVLALLPLLHSILLFAIRYFYYLKLKNMMDFFENTLNKKIDQIISDALAKRGTL